MVQMNVSEVTSVKKKNHTFIDRRHSINMTSYFKYFVFKAFLAMMYKA